MKNIFALSLTLLLSFCVFAQEGKLSKEDIRTVKAKAVQYMELGEYNKALEQYTILLRDQPENPEYNFQAGVVLFEGSFDKSKSIPLFEKVIEKAQNNPNPDAYYYLGRAYHYDQNYFYAIASYNTFLNQAEGAKYPKEIIKEVNEYIDQCEKGKEFAKANATALKNVDRRYQDITKFYTDGNNFVKLINLGKSVNSEYSEYGPILMEEGNFLLFTSRKAGSTGEEKYYDGQFFEDIYFAEKTGEIFTKIKNLNEVEKFKNALQNTDKHEATVAINTNENRLFFYQDKNISEIVFENGAWGEPKTISSTFAKAGNFVTSACLSPDEKSMILVSDRDDSFGGRDLYVVNKKQDGTWSEMVNVGKTLNTKKDEASPYFANDTTLYFSSKGHSSIGGYDVFVSYLRKTGWSTPQNLDIPINTPYDEINYMVSNLGEFGIYASNREESYGEYDIFFITKGYDEEIDPVLLAQFNEKEEDIKVVTQQTSEIIANINKDPETKKPNEEQLAVIGKTPTKPSQQTTDTTTIALVDNVSNKNDEKLIDNEPVLVLEKGMSKDALEKEMASSSNVSLKPNSRKPASQSNQKPTKVTTPETTQDEKGVMVFDDIQFEFNSTQLNDYSKQKLDEVAEKLKAKPSYFAEIVGHTDNVGTETANNNASRLRALRAYNYLLDKGIEPYRLSYSFKGMLEPIASNDTEEGRNQNRRVEVTFFNALYQAFIQFGFDEKEPKGEYLNLVNNAIKEIKANPNATVYLSGHTDPYGGAKYNLLLSQWRVESIEKILKENGVTNKIEKAYFGEDEPRYPNNLAETRKLNRRVQLVLY